MQRRHFIKSSALGAAALTLPRSRMHAAEVPGNAGELSTRLFSKHLQFLDYRDMADAAAEIGFDGIDLTVRPGGHVLPEKVQDDLPRAVEAIHGAGLQADLMATGVNYLDNDVNKAVLQTAAAQGIKLYRLSYFKFSETVPMRQHLAELNKGLKKLAKYNKRLGLTGVYQNHAGTRVGAAIWDIWHILENIDPSLLGCQYDIRHGMVEGGYSWRQGFDLIKDQIKCIVLKDFVWKKVDAKWKVVNVPLGEGMVDFDAYFKLLKKYNIQVPVTLHFEYPLGGAEHGARELEGMSQTEVVRAMKRDLQLARRMYRDA